MIILMTELRKNSTQNMHKTKFLQQCTLFHATVKHINVLKSMIFQITITQLADGHLGTISISGRFKKASYDASSSIKIWTVMGEISHL